MISKPTRTLAAFIPTILFLFSCSVVDQSSKVSSEDLESTRSAYENALSLEEKMEIADEFLERDSENQYLFSVVNTVTNDLLERDKQEAAFEFAEKHFARLTDAAKVKRANMELLRLAGKSRDRARLIEIIDRLGGGLSFETELEIARSARESEQWDLVLQHATQANEGISRESVQETLEGEEKWFIQGMYRYQKSEALFLKALAEVESGDLEAGLESYQKADAVITKNFLGITYGELNEKWAKALVEKQDWNKVMKVLELDALMVGDEKALDTYQKAYIASGGKKNELDDHLARAHEKIAREMPAFQAYNYEGDKVAYSDLKDDVTLLAFWFPT